MGETLWEMEGTQRPLPLPQETAHFSIILGFTEVISSFQKGIQMFCSTTDTAVLSRLYTTLTKGWFYTLRPGISKSFNIKSRHMDDLLCAAAALPGRIVAAAPAAALPLAW